MKNRQNHTTFLILSIAVTLFVGAVYIYMNYAVSNSIDRAVLARDLVRNEQANKNNEQNIINLYNSTKIPRSKLPSFLINANQAVKFIESIESLGSQVGSLVNISSIDSQKSENNSPGTFSSIKAHVEARGSWSSVMRTLMLFENLPYQSKINNVKISSSFGENQRISGRQWTLSLDVFSTLATPLTTI